MEDAEKKKIIENEEIRKNKNIMKKEKRNI